MKKSIILLVSLLVASVCTAQTLDEIVNKYYAANGTEVLEKATTLYMEGHMSQMGMEMPMTITVKKPNKVRVVITFSGMEIITTFDGEKGYMVNPLSGAAEPVEIACRAAGQCPGIQHVPRQYAGGVQGRQTEAGRRGSCGRKASLQAHHYRRGRQTNNSICRQGRAFLQSRW